jgi:nucleoside-diphosphate-sugar epimerase
MDMRVLMVGGTGFIGPYVAKELCERGHEVTVFHRGQHESELQPDVRHFRSEQAAVPVLTFPRELLRDQFELVIHMIPMGEADMQAAVQTFTGRATRLVALSSGDVYRAYGRFTGLEPGPVEEGLLHEDSPLRETFYPYRARAKSLADVNYYYEKILVERVLRGQAQLPGTVLRLPKVYGPGGNAKLATVYGYRDRPGWRWTHGYVENISAAIVLTALHPAAANRVYNIGEAYTPTIAERLQTLPSSALPLVEANDYDFHQNIAYDTARIRKELGYTEPVSYEEGLKRTFLAKANQPSNP